MNRRLLWEVLYAAAPGPEAHAPHLDPVSGAEREEWAGRPGHGGGGGGGGDDDEDPRGFLRLWFKTFLMMLGLATFTIWITLWVVKLCGGGR